MPATREQVAASFGEFVLRYGYRRASVDDVARALRISKQTIYEYFGSKEGLYRASVELWATRQRRSVEERLTQSSAAGRIAEVVAIAFADARASHGGTPYSDPSEPADIVGEVNAQVFAPMVRDLIEQGNASGELHVTDPETTAAFAVAIGMEAMRMMNQRPAADVEADALDAIRRLIGENVK